MAVGKSTLIRRLMAGEVEAVRRRLGLGAVKDWYVLDKTELPMLHAAKATTILCHYDILDFTTNPTLRDAVEGFISIEECRVVTLWAPPGTLQERIVEREFHGWPPAPSQKSNWNRWSRWARGLPSWLRNYLGRHFARRGSPLSHLMRRTLGITPMEPIFRALECYRDPSWVVALYESWREVCVASGAEQLIIDTTDGEYRFVEQPPWYDTKG